jgi:hypothetical protein
MPVSKFATTLLSIVKASISTFVPPRERLMIGPLVNGPLAVLKAL